MSNETKYIKSVVMSIGSLKISIESILDKIEAELESYNGFLDLIKEHSDVLSDYNPKINSHGIYDKAHFEKDLSTKIESIVEKFWTFYSNSSIDELIEGDQVLKAEKEEILIHINRMQGGEFEELKIQNSESIETDGVLFASVKTINHNLQEVSETYYALKNLITIVLHLDDLIEKIIKEA